MAHPSEITRIGATAVSPTEDLIARLYPNCFVEPQDDQSVLYFDVVTNRPVAIRHPDGTIEIFEEEKHVGGGKRADKKIAPVVEHIDFSVEEAEPIIVTLPRRDLARDAQRFADTPPTIELPPIIEEQLAAPAVIADDDEITLSEIMPPLEADEIGDEVDAHQPLAASGAVIVESDPTSFAVPVSFAVEEMPMLAWARGDIAFASAEAVIPALALAVEPERAWLPDGQHIAPTFAMDHEGIQPHDHRLEPIVLLPSRQGVMVQPFPTVRDAEHRWDGEPLRPVGQAFERWSIDMKSSSPPDIPNVLHRIMSDVVGAARDRVLVFDAATHDVASTPGIAAVVGSFQFMIPVVRLGGAENGSSLRRSDVVHPSSTRGDTSDHRDDSRDDGNPDDQDEDLS